MSVDNAACAVHCSPRELDLFDLRLEMSVQHGIVIPPLYPSMRTVTAPTVARDRVSAAVEMLQVLSSPAFPH